MTTHKEKDDLIKELKDKLKKVTKEIKDNTGLTKLEAHGIAMMPISINGKCSIVTLEVDLNKKLGKVVNIETLDDRKAVAQQQVRTEFHEEFMHQVFTNINLQEK